MTTPMNPYTKKPIIRVDNKAMFATIRFPAPDEGESAPQYDVDELESMLAQEGIVYGIDGNMLSSLSQEILFDTELIVFSELCLYDFCFRIF